MSNIELSDISGELVRSALHETIRTLTNSTSDRVKIVSKVITDNGSAIVCRVSFTTAHESKGSPASLILKVSSRNVARRMLMFTRQCFLREIFMYDEVCNQSKYNLYQKRKWF